MPALLTSTSIAWKRDSALSTTLAAVAGSPMWPSTRATWLEAATSVDWVTFRELATTLKPPSTNPLTITPPTPSHRPCDDPRADPLRSPGHDRCLRWVAHGCLLYKKDCLLLPFDPIIRD